MRVILFGKGEGMPKIKTLRFTINGEERTADLKCDSKGLFSIMLPKEVSTVFNVSQKIELANMSDVESSFFDFLHRYKTAKTTTEMLIGIRYGSSGSFANNLEGYPLFGHSSRFGVSLSFEGGCSSALRFDFIVLIKTITDGVATYNKAKKGDPRCDVYIAGSDPRNREKEDANVWYKNDSFYEGGLKDYIIIPFSETALETLKSTKEALQRISIKLHEFVSKDTDEVIALLESGNINQLKENN